MKAAGLLGRVSGRLLAPFRRRPKSVRPALAPRTKTALRATFPTWRARVVLFLLGGSFLALAARAVYLQTINEQWLTDRGVQRFARTWEIPASRGRILDRSGELLAVSTPVSAVWAIQRMRDGKAIEITQADVEAVAPLVGLPAREVRRRLLEPSPHDRVLLNRQVTPETAKKLAELKLPWIAQNRAYRRVYPSSDAMAHLVGFTNKDDEGIEGMELAFQSVLRGEEGSRRVIRDNLGRVVEEPVILKEARDGTDVTLAVDARIQHIAFRALKAAVQEYRAVGGGVVVIDVASGEVLALANLPSFDPNQRERSQPEHRRNRAVTDIYEPGSTLKPFGVALALDQGRVAPTTLVNTAPGSYTIHGATIRDSHAYGTLTVAEVIQKSSNVGAAKISLEHLQPEAMHGFFTALGFGRAPKLGFPGAAAGQVRPFKSWRPIEQATMSYGHGIALSLIQVARSYLIFARDGDFVPLSLVKLKPDEAPAGQRIVSPATAREMRKMLESVVTAQGTAPRAQIVGYRAGGKTGTARKLQGGAYADDKHIVSFVGFAPASAPRLIVAVMIDQPYGRDFTGGRVAAPVFATVMGGALRTLRVPPDAPLEPIRLPPVEEELAEST